MREFPFICPTCGVQFSEKLYCYECDRLSVPISATRDPETVTSDDLLDTSGDFDRPEDTQVGGDHYRTMTVQPWEFMQACSTPDEFKAHLRLCAIKYLGRCGRKDDQLKEIKKARHYLDKLISVLEDAE